MHANLPRRLALGITMALLVLPLPACGLFGSYPDKTIIAGESLSKDEATALLSRADRQFKEAVKELRATITKGSSCFVAFTDQDQGTADDSLWCGPARQYGASGQQAWWTFRVESDEGRVDISNEMSGPQKLNTKLSLARPDGIDPVTDADLAAPRPPAAEAGMIELMTDFSGAKLTTPKEPRLLVGPHFAVQLTQSGSAGVIGTGATARSAVDGEEFVYARFDAEPQIHTALTTIAKVGELPKDAVGTADDGDVAFTVIAGPTRKKLGHVADGNVVVASAPKGTSVQLEVTDLGKVQTMDLRTGARGGDKVFDSLYRSANSVDLNRQLHDDIPDTSSVGNPQRLTNDMTLGRATLATYDPEAGFPPQDSAWLCITIDRDESNKELTFTTDLSSFTLSPAGGQPSTPRFEDERGGRRLLFVVPASFATGTLAYRLIGSIDDSPAIAIKSPRTTQIPIAIPAS